MKCGYRRILRVSWVDRVTNNNILLTMEKSLEVVFTLKRRKLEYLGHAQRNGKYQQLQLIMQGKIMRKRSIGRRAVSWFRNLRDWYDESSIDLFHAAVSKTMIANMIANLRSETACQEEEEI